MSILKKIFWLSIFILAVSLLFWGVYNLSFKNNSETANKKAPGDKNALLAPTSANEKISPISDGAVIAPTLSPDKNSIDYFSQKNGHVYRIDFYGQKQKTLSEKDLDNFSEAAWSIDGSKAIIKTGAKNSSSFSLYDPSSGKITPLKKNLDEVVWQTNTNRILYKYYNPTTKERTLNVADPDGNNWTKLADLSYRNLSIAQVPRTGLISFWNSADAYAQTDFESIPVTGGDATGLNSRDFGADYLWSPTGNWVLVSHSDKKGGFKMALGVMNSNGGEYKDLGIPTFASKCAWSKDGKTVYYALPGDIPDNSVLPNDYNTGKFHTTDTFWKVDVATGKKTRLVDTGDIKKSFDASQMFLNSSESLLFFVNKTDGKLYKIIL